MDNNLRKLMKRIIHAKRCFEVYNKLIDECDGKKYRKIHDHLLRVNLESLVTTLVAILERSDDIEDLYSIPALLNQVQAEKKLNNDSAETNFKRFFPDTTGNDIYELINNLREGVGKNHREGIGKLKSMRNQLTAHLQWDSKVKDTASMYDIEKLITYSFHICSFLLEEITNSTFTDTISKETGVSLTRLYASANKC